MACHIRKEGNSKLDKTVWTSNVKNDKRTMLSALIMVISHPLVAEEWVGVVHLPDLLKIRTSPVSSPEAPGGTWRPHLVNGKAHGTAPRGTASKGLLDTLAWPRCLHSTVCEAWT